MPELPEVETLRRELSRVVSGQKILSAQVYWPKAVRPLSEAAFRKKIKGQKIAGVKRQAKMLMLDLAGPLTLIFHLKMTGQLIYAPGRGKKIVGGHPAPKDEKNLPNNHTRLAISFSNGSTLYFNDLRKFGWAKLVDDAGVLALTGHLGREPLARDFTAAHLATFFRRFPRRTVKQILMDQTLIAGIGNIYADESAFLAKILPNRQAQSVKPASVVKLHRAIVDTLKLSIKKKGTSARNYRRTDGSEGGFVPYLYVYGREKKLCKVCKTPIEKIRHNGRGTHFCPRCQK